MSQGVDTRLCLPKTALASDLANDMTDSFKSLGLVMPLAILLVYIVMASQFESLFSPFIIMFSMPPTLVGALLGLVLTHRAVSINALIGVIMLIGIVVNNAIVLVDYTNQLRERGLERNEAILQAGPVRLRPILMTTEVGGQAVLGRQSLVSTPWLTERHGYDPTYWDCRQQRHCISRLYEPITRAGIRTQ